MGKRNLIIHTLPILEMVLELLNEEEDGDNLDCGKKDKKHKYPFLS